MKNFQRSILASALASCFVAPAYAISGCGATDVISADQTTYTLNSNCVTINSGVTVTSTGSGAGALDGIAVSYVDRVVNNGTLDGGSSGYAVRTEGMINTFENYGFITGGLVVDAGSINTLINGQTGLGYYGNLPNAYYTYFSSPTTYGTVFFDTASSTSLTPNTLAVYGIKIAAGQNYATGTYNSVIVSSSSALTITTQEISGVTYRLVSSDGGHNWDLIIGSVSDSRVATPTGGMNNNHALNAARVIDANPNLLSLFTALTTDQQLSQAASQTLPTLTGGTTQVAKDVLSAVNNVIDARQAANRGQSSGDLFYGDRNFWIKPFGSRANQSGAENVAGYKAITGGLVFGVDGKVRDNLRVGGAFAFSNTNVGSNIDGGGSNSVNIKAYQLIGYGSYDLSPRDSLDFQADLGLNRNNSKRAIAFTGSTANAGYDSWTGHLGANLNRRIELNSRTTFTPSVRVDYTHVSDDGYTESGADLLDLNVNSRSADAMVFGADGKLGYQINDRWNLSGNLGVGYDVINSQNKVNSSFAGASATVFETTGIHQSPWISRVGLGLSYKLKAASEVSVRYDAEHRQGYNNQTASIKLNMPF